MTRTIPTTTWNDRTLPSTTWATPRWTDYVIWDEAFYSWDESEPDTWDTWWIQTNWDTPRYTTLLELENLLNIELENWELLQAQWWTTDNVIDTVWQ